MELIEASGTGRFFFEVNFYHSVTGLVGGVIFRYNPNSSGNFKVL